MNNPSVAILVLGFVFFAFLQGAKIKKVEKFAEIVAGFVASAYVVNRIFILVFFLAWVYYGLS